MGAIELEALEALLNRRSIDASELEALLAARAAGEIDFTLIDTREKYEHLHHWIDGDDLVLHTNGFYPKVKKLKDKERAYILYCSNGARSAMNAQVMRELGYKRALNLAKGIESCGGKMIKKRDDALSP
jgi:adenylyltransferase/sulfurtransferase